MDVFQQKALLRIAHDFSRGDTVLVASMKATVANPPATTEEVGCYLSGSETPFENCFRKLASLLSKTPYASSAEDKYALEIFDQWIAPKRLRAFPEKFTDFFSKFSAYSDDESGPFVAEAVNQLRNEFAEAMLALEGAFVKIGQPLLCIDTGAGDTILFINTELHVADLWRDTKIGVTYQNTELAIRSPMWDELWSHLCYSRRLDLGDPPPGLKCPQSLKSLDTIFP